MKAIVKRVGMVLPEGEEYGLRLLEGALHYAEQHRHIRLVEYRYDCRRRPGWLRHPLNFDGILLRAEVGEPWIRELQALDIPIVNTLGSWPTDRQTTLAYGGAAVVRAAVEFLGALGRPTLAVVGHDADTYATFKALQMDFIRQAAERGWKAVRFDAGSQRKLTGYPPNLTIQGQRRLKSFLRQLRLPAAIWAIDDYMGFVVIETARELGLAVPGQIAVLGLGNFTVSRICQPPLTSIPQSGDLIGYEALRLLDGLMAGRPRPGKPVEIAPPPIVERGSTAATTSPDDQIRYAHRFIVEHACRGIAVEDVLRTVPMSMPTLHKRFVELYGRTPGAEIRRLRLEQAKTYLRTTTLSILRVAELCGYDQQAKFSNFFRRETGMSPSQYRQRSTRAG